MFRKRVALVFIKGAIGNQYRPSPETAVNMIFLSFSNFIGLDSLLWSFLFVACSRFFCFLRFLFLFCFFFSFCFLLLSLCFFIGDILSFYFCIFFSFSIFLFSKFGKIVFFATFFSNKRQTRQNHFS